MIYIYRCIRRHERFVDFVEGKRPTNVPCLICEQVYNTQQIDFTKLDVIRSVAWLIELSEEVPVFSGVN